VQFVEEPSGGQEESTFVVILMKRCYSHGNRRNGKYEHVSRGAARNVKFKVAKFATIRNSESEQQS
jgi:hypothetical protein